MAGAAQEGSPHTRGWTLGGSVLGRVEEGFPAHAGMDPAAPSGRRRRSGVPRTRGDGPSIRTPTAWAFRGSPHTRGWTRDQRMVAARRAGFPAHAGMDLRGTRWNSSPAWVPRTRGDGPAIAAVRRPDRSGSPHTRGWTCVRLWTARPLLGFPAHAGMDRRCGSAAASRPRVPRTRGDGPNASSSEHTADRGSPHTRGWTRHPGHGRDLAHGFPAHAGMDPRRRGGRRPARWVPRTRGDGP